MGPYLPGDESGADVFGVGVVEVVEDGQCLLPGVAGSVGVVSGVGGVAEMGEGVGFLVAVGGGGAWGWGGGGGAWWGGGGAGGGSGGGGGGQRSGLRGRPCPRRWSAVRYRSRARRALSRASVWRPCRSHR